MAVTFFTGKGAPIHDPEEVAQFLASEGHWRPGHPLYEVVHSWIAAKGIPPSVQAVLATDPVLAGAKALKVYFEKETGVDQSGQKSLTDVVALVGAADRNAIVGIEAKVDEPFGPVVIDWNNTAGRDDRIEGLLRILGIRKENAWHLRYQLLHRAAAIVIEAASFRTRDAALIIQSFSASSARYGFRDFQEFTSVMDAPLIEPGRLTEPIIVHGISVRFGWAEDRPREAI
jgi:hypothetical protein